MINLFQDFLNWTGTSNVSGGEYGFFSGFGSDLAELAIFGVVFRKLNCHSPGCWRLGHHETADGKYRLCRKHHPDVPRTLTLAHIVHAHEQAKDERAAVRDS